MNDKNKILMKFISSKAQEAQEENNVFVDKSKIQGKGLFTNKNIREGEVIGLAHSNGQPVGKIGKFHNHSFEPNAISIEQGNQRYLVAAQDLPVGSEITTDYTMQPELEQPSFNWTMKTGGQHGGLDRWFAEKWVDVKTGKECGRQEGEKRAGYPACRPSKRINSDTPKTASELSQSEKEKFKRSKTSSKRIDYNHKRNEFGGENLIENNFTMKDYNELDMMAKGGNVPTNPELWSRAKAAAKSKYDVYPSAYANGYAAKWYKEKGGSWRKAEFGMEVSDYAFGGYIPEMMNGGCMECGGQMEYGGEPETNSLSPQDLNNWNQFIKYAKKSGAASDDRYNHDKKLGYELIKKYNQENPDAAIDSNKVKDYQSYFLNMAAGNTASGQMGVKTANSFKNGISRVDGFLGLKTLNQMVPKVSTEINGVRTDYGSDFASANRNFAGPQAENLKKFVNYDNATAQQQQAFDEAMLARKKQEIAAQVRKPVATSGNPNNPANYQEFLASGESWAPAPDGGFYVKQYGGEMQPQQQESEESQKTGNIDDALGEISMMLEGGTNPDDILKMLMEQGLSEEQGQGIIQSAMNDIAESDMEEEDVPLDTEDIEDTSSELLESDDEMKYGGIKIDPRKKGTFKAQATKMGMSVQEAAEHILNNKEEYSPEMVKKANFARNFAKELGGQLYEMAEGGTIPSRYKNMGFTKVGVKKQSTRPGKKWMVLAKKGDQYKVVHGGWKGMQDFKQHGSEKRKDRFWDRMGGRDSAKAKDPFSPLYWHKRFGTWAEGGENDVEMVEGIANILTQVNDPQNRQKIAKNMIADFEREGVKYDLQKFLEMAKTKMQDGGAYDYDTYTAGDQRTDVTESHTLNSLKNNSWNRGLAAANSLGDPRSMVWALPNKGLLGTVKGIAGAAAGLSGAVLGYEKLFAKPKTTEYVVNPETQESGKLQDVIQARKEKQDAIMKDWSSPEMYQDSPLNEKRRKDNMIPSGPMGPGDFDGGYPSGPSYENLARYGGTMRRYQDGGDTPLTYDEWMAQNGRGLMGEEGRDMNDYQQYLAGFKAANTPATATSVGGVETAQTPGGNAQPGTTSPTANGFTQTKRGDTAGIVAANNALAGLGMVNQVLGAKDYQKEYEQRLKEIGNTMNRYNPQNAINPFGNYTLNAGPASNFGLVANTPIQDFGTKMSSARYGGLIPFIPATRHYAEGGEFYADEEEIKRILAMGGEIEYLD